jgi:hypothetical protein
MPPLSGVTKQMLLHATTALNSYTVDICDILWRCWAFTDRQSEKSSLRLLPRPLVVSLQLPYPSMALSMFMHRALLGYARKFISLVSCILMMFCNKASFS